MITFKQPFPLKKQALIHCLTNEISCESVANAILSIGAKPIMMDDPREIADFFGQSHAVLLNLGHLSEQKEKAIRLTSQLAYQSKKPTVVDLVGVTASSIRHQLAHDLIENHPTVVKGNTAEMRAFCGLNYYGKGVDAHQLDQDLTDLVKSLAELSQQFPTTCFLATGAKDLVVYQNKKAIFKNGSPLLDQFTGTGDIVGALIACLLGAGEDRFEATALALSYFNICGQGAEKNAHGLTDFRFQTLNQLSLLLENSHWLKDIKGEYL